MKTIQDVIDFCLTIQGAYLDYPFDEQTPTMRFSGNKKIFALIFDRADFVWVNVKCSPDWTDFWRGAFESVIPGYHMNKRHWNTIILDGSIPDEDIKRMILESFGLVRGKIKQK